jgi:hypothetical protein
VLNRLSGPVEVLHWLYFDAETSCREAAGRLTDLGVDIFRERREWCIRAKETMVLTDESIAEAQARMEAFAAEVGADYRHCNIPVERPSPEQLANIEIVGIDVLEPVDTTPGFRGVVRRWRRRLWRWILSFG